MVPKRYLIWKMKQALSFHWSCVCVDLSDVSGLGLDHHHKVSIVIKRVVVLLLVEGLDFNLQKNVTSVKENKAKHNKIRYAYIQMWTKKVHWHWGPLLTGVRCWLCWSGETMCKHALKSVQSYIGGTYFGKEDAVPFSISQAIYIVP